MMRTSGRSRGRSGDYYKRYLTHYAKKNHTVLLMGAIFLLGVVLGTFLVRSAESDTLSTLLRIVGGYVDKRRDQGLSHNFVSAAVSSVGMLGVLYVCGFCAISQPVIICVPLFRGLGFGCSAATMFAYYGTSAAGYVGVFLLPGMVLSTLAILYCCNESLRLANSTFAAIRGGEREEPYSLRIYSARFLVLGILCLLSALLEAALFFAFANSFVLG